MFAHQIRNWFVRWITGSSAQSADNEFDFGSDDEEEEDREEKKTIKERLQTIQEVSQSVQNTIGRIASLGESVKKWAENWFFYPLYLSVCLSIWSLSVAVWLLLLEPRFRRLSIFLGFFALEFYRNISSFVLQHIQLFRIGAKLVGRHIAGAGLFRLALHTNSNFAIALGLC